MNNRIVKQIFVIIFSFCTIISYAQVDSQDAEQIKQINSEWLNAYYQKDAITLNKILIDDFVMVTDRGKEIGKNDLINSIVMSPDTLHFVNDSVRIQVYGNSALLIGYGKSIVTNKNGTDQNSNDERRNCYSSFFVKRNGSWQASGTFIMLLREPGQ